MVQRQRYHDDDEILKDGERLTVPMFMKDGSINPDLNPTQRAVASIRQHQQQRDASLFDASLHRPGYRTTIPVTNDARRAINEARVKMYGDADAELSQRWRGNTSRSIDENNIISDSGNSNHRRDGLPTMDAIYQAYDDEIQNSWRRK